MVKIADGDTVCILDSAQEHHKIRLQGIDAPERKQAFGKKAKEYLIDLVAGEPVLVDWNKRIDGKIIHPGRDINLEMARAAGLAWWYRKYAEQSCPPVHPQ